MPRIYYAHPLSLYDTPQEQRDVKLLHEGLGFEVVNPNKPEHQEGYKQYGMEYFVRLVKTCDALAFRAFPDGKIGAGIAGEIEALGPNKTVIELPHAISCRTLTIDQTREYLKELGQR